MSEFLTEPSLFPRRIAGETWGDHSVTIALAGDRYRIDGLSASQEASLRARYGTRLTDGDGVLAIHVFRAPRTDFREIDTRGWLYALELEWGEDSVAMSGMRLMARADFASARAGLWTCVDDTEEFWGVLENVLRPLLAARLLAAGGVLVHSAAVDGFLFPSASGGGKSTIAAMGVAAGKPVLSDDMNAVVPDGDRFVMLPLPFTGDLGPAALSDTPQYLRAIVALEKTDSESTRPLALAETVSLLVRCAPYVNQDAHRTLQLMDRAAEVATAAARAVLTFRVGGDVWPILERLR